MAERAPAWLGAIYLREEGGYRIVLKALKHYKKRLRTIGRSPELSGAAAMFASVLHQQAVKTIPDIDATATRIYESLGLDGKQKCEITMLADDIPFMEKALTCYKADIHKAQDTGHEYFVGLVGDMESAVEDMDKIESALQRIKSFEGQT